MHSFREAVQTKNVDAVAEVMADDIVLQSPISFRPFEGKPAVMFLLSILFETFEDFGYTDELTAGNRTVLIFSTRVGDKQVQGMDYLTTGDDGLVTEVVVMVRPLSAAHALRDAVGPRLLAAQEQPAEA
jgi:SnoaL-like domain